MSLITVVILVLIFCLLWYAIGFVPVPAAPQGGRALPIRSILYVLLIIVAVVYLLRFV